MSGMAFVHTESFWLISYSCCNVSFLSIRKIQAQFQYTEKISTCKKTQALGLTVDHGREQVWAIVAWATARLPLVAELPL